MYDCDCENVIWQTKKMAQEIGFSAVDVSLIATVASELTTNIIRYAKIGKVTLSGEMKVQNNQGWINIIATDWGPGIFDLDKAMEVNYSTLQGSLGLGLPSVKRIVDEFNIDTKIGLGTTVSVRKYLE
jgi:serine/threonine-protein kinase RsbT